VSLSDDALRGTTPDTEVAPVRPLFKSETPLADSSLFLDVVREAVQRHQEETIRRIDEACWRGLELGVGVLVLTKHGVPFKCGPWHSVPVGEIHYTEEESWPPCSGPR
jgi:hypothetical protein